MKIFINAGHDIEKDPGAINKNLGLTEANIACKVSKHVVDILKGIGYTVYFMQDKNLNLVTKTANNWNADIFVSIHCNGFSDKSANGTETLYHPSSVKGKKLAECLQKQMLDEFGLVDRGLKARPNLAVLRQTKMPSALAEMAFISNEKEALLMANNPERWGNAIARGITDYINIM